MMTTFKLLPRLETGEANKLRREILQSTTQPKFSRTLLEASMESPKAFPATGGTRTSESELIDFRQSCIQELEQARREISDFNMAFDLALGRRIHILGKSAEGELGVAQVWDFLTLVILPDLAFQRINSTSSGLNKNEGPRSRLTGGDRRHLFQRLWKRRTVFGAEITEGLDLTEDDYGSMLERRLTLEHRILARKVATAIIQSGYRGTARRDYTRLLMRTLVQMSGIVQFNDNDTTHLDASIERAHGVVLTILRDHESADNLTATVGHDISTSIPMIR